MDIVFLGSGAFGIPALEALVASPHRIVQVISQPDRPAGRGNKLTPTPVSAWAAARGLPLVKTENVNAGEARERIGACCENGAGCLVVIAFGQKISDELLAMAKFGGINLHSSLLPKYRGAAPINWAIINGDEVAGVSVIEVTCVMDAGDVLAGASTPIGDAETAGELHDRLAMLGAPLLSRVLDALAGGIVTRIPQDHAKATRAGKLSREIAWVDFSKTAREASARIRGLSPWPGVQVQVTDAAGKPRGLATILKCRAVGETVHPPEICGTIVKEKIDGREIVLIACSTGGLELLAVQPAGKKPMDGRSFANGYGLTPGACLGSGGIPPLECVDPGIAIPGLDNES